MHENRHRLPKCTDLGQLREKLFQKEDFII